MPLKLKKQNKKNLQKYLGLREDEKIPFLAIDLQYFNYDFEKDLADLLDGLKRVNLQVVIFGARTEELKKQTENNIYIEEKDQEKCLQACDMVLFLSDDKQIADSVFKGISFGAVPVCLNLKEFKGLIESYDPIAEKGCGFLFENFNKWEIFATIIRAVENYRFVFDWQNIVSDGQDSVKAMKIMKKSVK